MIYKLKDICTYRNEKIDLNEFDNNDYISTDNMLPSFGGICDIKSIPRSGKVNKFYNDDILISNIRPYFKKMILSNKKAGCSNDIIILNVNKKIVLPSYLYYRLMINNFFSYMMLTSKGTKMPRGDKNAIMQYELEVAPILIQYKIVNVLSKIDNKIKLNNQINNNLHELIITMYSEYINQETASDKYYKAKELLSFDSGIEPGSKNYESIKRDGAIKFYRVGDMLTECNTYVDKNLIGNNIIVENDIVVSFDATIGRVGFGLNGGFSTGMRRIRSNNKFVDIPSSFIYAYFNSKNTLDILNENARGTTILHAGTAINFLEIKVNENIMGLFDKINPLFDKMLSIKKQNQTLTQLRETLLPKLMNGEIDLENIEI